jgi:pimeloyl-ACP methyl ester carboxylesterase
MVPGAWLGGWCWRDVATDLREAGHRVIGATLTGLGERVHLASRETSLETHVMDVIGILRWRDLNEVTLVGHSYGGTVITAAAEQAAERLRQLVYLDASVPHDGESNDDVIGPVMAAQLRASARSAGDGWLAPPADYVTARLTEEPLRSWVIERVTPHPLRPFGEPVRLSSSDAAALPRAFIQTTRSPLYDGLMARAQEAGWPCREIGGGHYAMFTQPSIVARTLHELAL